ncbi:type I secretion C-terminal target domain-containing protein, partial [Vibrio parahaemolyticus]|nr:type I secretion C-terminal target domain-containing protein [Vibrio parahaemolyticus]
VNITVNPINDAPVLVDANNQPLGESIAVTTEEEVKVGGKLSATDADGDTLTFTQSSDPQNGTVTVDANGNWTYDPNPDFHGNDKFDVIVSDGKGGTDTITINVIVIAVADPILVSVNISSEPTYSSGGKYEGGKNYIDWGTVEKEYGDNAKTLTDTTDDPFKNTLDTGSYAYRGMEGSDSIRITSQGDNVLVGEDGIIGNSSIDGSPMTGLVNDTLTAGAGNDILMGEQGDDSLYGAAGVDTAVYAGNFADYDITKPIERSGSSIFFEVTDKRIISGENVYAREGSDDLYDIERLQFADGTYYWDGDSWVKEQPTYTYSIDINVRLTDLDGSETITQIVLSGLPQGSVLSGLPDGVKMYDADANVIKAVGADGVIVLTRESGLWNASDTQVSLPGVQIKVPAELANDIELKVTATGEESSNQSQSSGFDSVTIDPSINVVSGTETDNNLQGKIGLDILKGLSGNDALFGSDGNDSLNGGEGNDLLIGGQGNDVLIGGSGIDTFAWDLSESINDIDSIQDFNLTEDKLNLSDLLKDATAETLDDYLSISQNGEDSVISIKINTEDSVNIILENIDSGNLKNNLGIITNNLLNNDNGKIILDDQLSNNIPIDKPMVIQSQQEENNG